MGSVDGTRVSWNTTELVAFMTKCSHFSWINAPWVITSIWLITLSLKKLILTNFASFTSVNFYELVHFQRLSCWRFYWPYLNYMTYITVGWLLCLWFFHTHLSSHVDAMERLTQTSCKATTMELLIGCHLLLLLWFRNFGSHWEL